MEPQGFEPRSRPYEWNELAAVLYPCQDHFLRVLPLHQGSVKLVCVAGFEPAASDFQGRPSDLTDITHR